MSQSVHEVERIHWVTSADRPLCEKSSPLHRPNDEQLPQIPFCGGCLHVLMYLGLHNEGFWKDYCAPPDLQPSEALQLLTGSRWENFFNVHRPVEGENTWWFQRGDQA